MYGMGISFPTEPTKRDIKELRKQVAYETFKVVDGGQSKKKLPAGKAKTARKKS